MYTVFLFALATFFATLFGGVIALRFKHKAHLLFGFTAGVILSVVFFDLLPEIIHISNILEYDVHHTFIWIVLGFILFHIAEKAIVLNHSHEDDYGEHKHPVVGMWAAGALIGHSFLDGVGIGIGFQLSPAIGTAIAIAVLSHDFADGINTVTLMLASENTKKKTTLFLLFDALAPMFGAGLGFFFSLSLSNSLAYLSIFAGFLLYIGASHILPEAHSKHSSWTTVFMTVLGTIITYTTLSFIV
jgi:ZIP family zinc transporter